MVFSWLQRLFFCNAIVCRVSRLGWIPLLIRSLASYSLSLSLTHTFCDFFPFLLFCYYFFNVHHPIPLSVCICKTHRFIHAHKSFSIHSISCGIICVFIVRFFLCVCFVGILDSFSGVPQTKTTLITINGRSSACFTMVSSKQNEMPAKR